MNKPSKNSYINSLMVVNNETKPSVGPAVLIEQLWLQSYNYKNNILIEVRCQCGLPVSMALGVAPRLFLSVSVSGEEQKHLVYS